MGKFSVNFSVQNGDILYTQCQHGIFNGGGNASNHLPVRGHNVAGVPANEDIAWLAPLLTATEANLHFLIRLHPAESRDEKCLEARTTALETPRVEVMRASRTPMSVLLRECSLHLTGYSSSILDALAFAVPSLCYAWSSKWFYNPAHYPFVRMVTPEVDAVMEAIRTHGPATTASPAAPLCLTLNELGRQLMTEILTPHTRKKV